MSAEGGTHIEMEGRVVTGSSNTLNPPIPFGMLPSRVLLSKYMNFSAVHLSNSSDGMLPLRLLSVRDSFCKRKQLLSVGGSKPVSAFSLASSSSRDEQHPDASSALECWNAMRRASNLS